MYISFYPGPSKVYPRIVDFVKEAHDMDLLSANHRSPEFVDTSQKAITLVKEKLQIPSDYVVMYASSATECWEILAQSLIQKKSFHIYNGAFGQKWMDYTQKLKAHLPDAQIQGFCFDVNEEADLTRLQTDRAIPEDNEMICFTQNETSNATAVDTDIIRGFQEAYPDQLVAVDATSSLGGIKLDFGVADLWYASVQKCLGLPAGMAILICSPRAVERAYQINERNHYNSLAFMLDKIQEAQTTYTPNVLNIYLLMRVLETRPSMEEIHENTLLRAEDYYNFFGNLRKFSLLVENPRVRSQTVIAAKAFEDRIQNLLRNAKAQRIILGKGYGEWKDTTFRIANFPAIDEPEILLLKRFFLENRR